MTKILLASDDVEFERYLRDVLGSPNGDLRRVPTADAGGDPPRVASHLTGPTGSDAEVIALGPDIDLDLALGIAELVDATRPDTSLVLLTWPEGDLVERAMRAGCRDVVAPDIEPAELTRAIERAAEATNRRRTSQTTPAVDTPRITVVLSPKGGSGKTTLATNLAVGLASGRRGDVVLVDLDLAFGDVATALGATPEQTVTQAVAAMATEGSMGPKLYLSEHETGAFLLFAPETPEQAELVSPAETTDLLRALSSSFHHVIVDTAAGMDDHALAALDVATDVVLVCTMDVPSIRSLSKAIRALDDLGFVHQRRHVVLNRAATKVGLSVEDVERTLGMPIDVTLESSRSVPLSMNQGQPLLAGRQSGPLQRELTRLVARFGGNAPAAEQRASVLERWSARWA
jgi:pilus assembly protein CpaE